MILDRWLYTSHTTAMYRAVSMYCPYTPAEPSEKRGKDRSARDQPAIAAQPIIGQNRSRAAVRAEVSSPTAAPDLVLPLFRSHHPLLPPLPLSLPLRFLYLPAIFLPTPLRFHISPCLPPLLSLISPRRPTMYALTCCLFGGKSTKTPCRTRPRANSPTL